MEKGAVQGKRTDAFNHHKAVAEAIPALSWVVYSGPGCGKPPESKAMPEFSHAQTQKSPRMMTWAWHNIY